MTSSKTEKGEMLNAEGKKEADGWRGEGTKGLELLGAAHGGRALDPRWRWLLVGP